MTRKIATVVVFCAVVMMVSASTAFAAPVVSSLDDLSAYGVWIAQGNNGRTTKTDTVTSADFALAEGFVAQYYAGGETKNIAKTGGDRTIPSGAAASVYDERGESKKSAPKASREAKTFTVKTVEELLALTGAAYVDGSDNTMVKVSLNEANGYVQGDVLDIQFAGKFDSSEGLDKDLPAKVTAITEITVKDFAKAEPEHQITEYAADQLITADDVLKIFGGKKGAKGQVEEVPIPAYTRFTVHESWACVSLWDSTQAPADYVVETGNQEQKVTFWPNPEYWQTKNTIEVKAADIEKLFDVGEPVVEGSVWQTVSAKAEMAGKILSLDTGVLTAVTVKADGVVLETPVITVPATGTETAADAADVVRICKKADLVAADYTTLAGIRKASPVEVKVTEEAADSHAVRFYVALASWKPAIGGNLLGVDVDPTHVEAKDGVYTSKDGYHIQFATCRLRSVADAKKAAATGNGGGGGGGCDAGFGALALVALPLVFIKRGRK